MLHRLEKIIQIFLKLKCPPFQIYDITEERVLTLGKNLNPVIPPELQEDKWIQFKSRCFTKQHFHRLWEYLAHDVKLCLSLERKGYE